MIAVPSSANQHHKSSPQRDRHIYGSSRLGMDTRPVQLIASFFVSPSADGTIHTTHADDRVYELTNHLGNVLATFTARKLPVEDNGVFTGFSPHVTSLTDYYPFGSGMEGRMVDKGYRYGFNCQEKDDEISGSGNSVNFTFRMYDPRIGRMRSLDPLAHSFPYYSPYHFASNSPLVAVDLEGLQSSVQLNYPEKAVVITRDGSGRLTINKNQKQDIGRYGRWATGAWNPQDYTPGGDGFEVFCTDCFGSNGPGLMVHISIPEQGVTRSVDVIRTANKNSNDSTGKRISATIRHNGTLVDVGDYSPADKIPSISGLTTSLQNGLDELNSTPLSDLQINALNVQVNAALDEDYRSDLQNQLTAQFGSDVTINVTFDSTLPSTTAARGDIDYQYSETTTEEVSPVETTP